MCEDGELLKRYSETGDEEAFAELVQRHVNFVYSVALRQIRDPHLAEDITQLVFLKLARRSASLPQGVVLAGWLHSDTRFASLEIMRKERRRVAREVIPMEASEENNWAELQPVIDDVLSKLDTAERDAVLLRFFHERSFAEIGAALRLAPDAARMRVNRALDKLRDLLEKRGIKTTASALGAALLAHSIQAAPAGIATRIMGSLPELAASSATPFWLSKGVLAGGALVGVAVALLTLIRQPTGTTSGNTVASQTSVPAAAVAATGETQPANLTSTTPNDSLPRKTLTLKVVDGNSAAPLQRVEVKWWTFTDVLKSRSETFFTAPDGQVDLSYPVEHARDFHFRAHLAVDGYVPRHVSWSVFQHDQLEDIPSEYTAKMDRGIEIGGNVRDINNQPISDVKVIFTGPSPVGVPPRERDTVMGSYHTETTDANGAWRCNHVRPEFASTTFKLEHPFFRSVTYGCKETDQPSIGPTLLPAADFLARRAEMRMERGLIVSGVVLDESGKPIAGALVAKEREWSPKEKTRTTSAAGEFAFHDAEAGHVILTAQAEGFAPGTITTELEGAETKLTFRLQRSLGLRAKFVDQNGNPVAGAEVNPGQDGSYRKFYRWTAKSDAKGLVSWDSSPNEPLELTVFAYGIGYTNFVVKPGETLQTFTLVSKTEIHQYTIALRAIDNETKQMIPHATLHVEEHNAGGGVSPFQGAREGNNGVFKFVSSDPQARYVFEIRAAGYRPARSQLIHLAETPELDLVLEKGEAIEGTVLGPSGEPVSGASVALCSEEKGAILSTDQRFLFTDQSAVVSTDANGKFKHEPLTGAHTIYVIHQSGFAAIRLDKSQSGTTISLQPWGRIEGVAQFNGAVAGNMELGLMTHNPNGNERSLMLYTFQTMTDSQGRFVFENVPPMELKLSWMRPISRGKSYSHSMTIDVQSGATTPVIYAPEGGLVRGRFVFEDDSTIDWSTQARLVHFGVKMETPSYEQFRHDPVLAKKAYNDFWQSDEGRAWTRKQRNYAPEVRPDGTFEIPAVPPGEYVLHIQLQEKSETRIPFGKTIGTAEKSVTIPEGQTEFNLGDIVVKKR